MSHGQAVPGAQFTSRDGKELLLYRTLPFYNSLENARAMKPILAILAEWSRQPNDWAADPSIEQDQIINELDRRSDLIASGPLVYTSTQTLIRRGRPNNYAFCNIGSGAVTGYRACYWRESPIHGTVAYVPGFASADFNGPWSCFISQVPLTERLQ